MIPCPECSFELSFSQQECPRCLGKEINTASDIIDEMFLELPYDDINDEPTCTICGFITTSGTLHTESCPIAPLENLLRKLRQTITYRSF